MRLSKGRVTHLADAVLRRLEEGGQIECTGPRAGVVEAVERAITEEANRRGGEDNTTVLMISAD